MSSNCKKLKNGSKNYTTRHTPFGSIRKVRLLNFGHSLIPCLVFRWEKYILYVVFAFGQTFFKVNVLFKYTQNPLEIFSPKKDFVLEICLKVLMRNGQYSISVCKVLVY